MFNTPGFVTLFGKRQQGRAFFLQQLGLAGMLTPQTSLKIMATTVLQLGIEGLKAAGVGQRNHEVASGESDQAFYLPLLVGTPDQAEV